MGSFLQVACKTVLMAACLATSGYGAGDLDKKTDPRILGTWVLKAVGSGKPYNPLGAVFTPVSANELLQFVFDGDTFEVRIKNEAPLSLDYSFRVWDELASIHFWRTKEERMGTFCGILTDDTFFAEISTSHGLLPWAIDSDPEKTLCFMFKRVKEPPKPPTPVDGTWRLIEVTRDSDVLIGKAGCEKYRALLSFSKGRLTYFLHGKVATQVLCTVEVKANGELVIRSGKDNAVPGNLSKDGKRFAVQLSSLLKGTSGLRPDDVFHFERLESIVDDLTSALR